MPKFDRLVEFDERSRNFAVSTAIAPVAPFISQTYRCDPFFDQGAEGACVGFGLGTNLSCRPIAIKGLTNQYNRERFYWEAQRTDPWPGGSYPGAKPKYEGTSVLAGVKVGQKMGFYSSYRWQFSLDDVKRGIPYLGPGLGGFNWREGMMDTDRAGYIHATGPVVGGHCICIRGVNIEKGFFILRNSWGPGWGLNGDCLVSFADMEIMLRDQGEVAFPIDRKKIDPYTLKASSSDKTSNTEIKENMNRLIEIITAAIAVIAGYRTTISEQKDTIKDQADVIQSQADTITNLQQQVANDKVDDVALKEAADTARKEAQEARDRLAEVEDPDLETKAQELANLLNDTHETPSVDPSTFEVTEPGVGGQGAR